MKEGLPLKNCLKKIQSEDFKKVFRLTKIRERRSKRAAPGDKQGCSN